MSGDLPDDWFRPDSPGPGESVVPPATDADDGERYTDQFKPGYHAGVGAGEPVRATPVPRPPSVPVVGPPVMPATSPPSAALPRVRRGSWMGRHPGLATLMVIALALTVGLAAGQLLRQRTSRSDPTPTPGTTSASSSPSQSATTGSSSVSAPAQPWNGPTLRTKASGVAATCTADPQPDTTGKPVRHDAALAIDDDAQTAWRCNGDGRGQKLSFRFPKGTVLVGVGVANGYTKVADKQALYDQYRRVLSVEWRLSDGSWFTQSLADNNTTTQQVLIPPVAVDGQVTMTIVSSTDPGSGGGPSQDAVLISQVDFFTKP